MSSEFDDAIRDARDRLDAFERGTSRAELITRLRTSSPLHPFLLLRALALLATMATLAMAVAALALPLVPGLSSAAELVMPFDEATGVPLFAILAVLVVCFFVVAAGAHFAAIAAARSAPLLAHEAKAHQRLVSDLKQLEAQRAVSARLTPRPSEPRSSSGRPAPTRYR